ncbi:hypothetical protein C9J47_04075 [Photobacterium indicum]|uniref:Uncharacterized protein n=1 Tax=Photobacterium indicum TaxID=81447 RepID=A0A2T3LEF7_9GAMM|nr:hypothetical protein C9J47_04075 [Photobacterium indicum]
MINWGIFISAVVFATTLLHAMLIVGALASGRAERASISGYIVLGFPLSFASLVTLLSMT